MDVQFSAILSRTTDLRDRACLQACTAVRKSPAHNPNLNPYQCLRPPYVQCHYSFCHQPLPWFTIVCPLWLHSMRQNGRGLHGLSCRRSVGRHPRHKQLNTIIKQSLASADIPSVLEPQRLSHSDGKRPNGMTIVPWISGQLLLRDATCRDTTCQDSYAPSNMQLAASRKRETYRDLTHNHHFVPVAVETTGSFGKDAI